MIDRVKRLRSAIVPDLVTGRISEEERARRWRQLADIYLAQQLSCYPNDYISEEAAPERLLETVERFEEDLTDVASVHGPLRVVIQVGPALDVSPERPKGGAEDRSIKRLEQQLQEMLQGLANEPRKKLEK